MELGEMLDTDKKFFDQICESIDFSQAVTKG
jgi:hypothetical protein